MKAYLIDPAARTLSAVDVATESGNQLRSMYRHLDCSAVDCVRDVIPGHDLWIDDEGALYEEPPHGLFYADGTPQQVFFGRALVMSSNDEGDTTAATCSADDITQRIAAVVAISGLGISVAPLVVAGSIG
jgi:hypothetical protein